MFWDSAPGLIVFVAARGLGVSPLLTLMAASVATLFRAISMSVRLRRIDAVSVLIVGTLAASCAMTLVTGSARVLMVKDSVISAVAGIAFLGSAFTQAPLAWQFVVRAAPDAAGEYRRRCTSNARYQRAMRVTTVVWGGGLCSEALVRIPVVLWLPVDLAAVASTALSVATVAALAAWTAWYRRRGAVPAVPAVPS
jgi:hypothetical protein